MDIVNKEGTFPHDEPSAGPPTLIESALDFGRVPQGSQKTLQQILVNTTRQPMIWLADAGELRWLTLEPGHGVLQPGEQQSIRVTADTGYLPVGEHSVTLTFSLEGDETSMSRDTISKVMVEAAQKPGAPRSLEAGLNFGGLTPQSTSTLMLLISNPDDRSVEWEIQIGKGVRETLEYGKRPAGIKENLDIRKDGAVVLSKSNGMLPPYTSETVFVTANTAKLKSGYSYKTNLSLISKADATASTCLQVPIAFFVNLILEDDGGPKPPPYMPPNINFAIQRRNNVGTTTMSFTNDNNTTVHWKLVSDAAWLVANPSHGTFDPNVTDTVVLTAHRPGPATGYYTTNLRLILSWHPTDGHDAVVMIPVTLDVQ
jgi:hypothetical protein